MPKKRFTDEQIAFALRQAEAGTTIGEICRKMGIAEATFYRWKKVYAGMGVAEIRRLKQLEEENSKLKRLVAEGWARPRAVVGFWPAAAGPPPRSPGPGGRAPRWRAT